MRQWLSLLAAAALALGASAAPATADSSQGQLSGGFFGASGPDVGSTTSANYPVGVSGLVTIDFHSDPASGCAHLSACGYHGTIIFRPASGELNVDRYTVQGRPHTDAQLTFDAYEPVVRTMIYARVLRDGGGTCIDAVTNPQSVMMATGRRSGSGFVFRLTDALAPTRCAGPLPSDLSGALPALRTPAKPSRGTRLDTRGVATIAGHGFAGTVTSTVVFTVGRGVTQTQSRATTPPGRSMQRIRTVIEELSVVHSSGSVVADVRGTAAGDACVLLDSCGLTGKLTLTPKPVGSQGLLFLSGPVKLPYRDFLVALGVRAGVPRRGLTVGGDVFWADQGTLHAAVSQTAICTDDVDLGGGILAIQATRTRVLVKFGSTFDGSSGTLGGRTRCPGPSFPNAPTLASGSAPRSVLRHRTFTVTLHAGGSFADDGYNTTLHGAITLTLRAGRITSQVQEVPTS